MRSLRRSTGGSRRRIDASVRRILAAKAAVGLTTSGKSSGRAAQVLSAPDHQRWAQDRRPFGHAGPRPEDAVLRRSRVVASCRCLHRSHSDDGKEFAKALERRGAKVETVRLWKVEAERLARARRAARGADVVVFSSFARAMPWKGDLGLPRPVAELADALAANGAIVVSFGDPYLLRQIPRARTYMLAWSESEVAQRAAARALSGSVMVAGRLPIPLPPDHAIGEGLRVPALAGASADVDVGEDVDDVLRK